MSRFKCTVTPLSGLMVVDRQSLDDDRGSFTRLFCAQELAGAGWPGAIAQINHSETLSKGSVRGLHYQKDPHSECKLVSCLRGRIWDLAVDLRSESSTFLQWHAEELSRDNGRALLIPPGFAHGFQTLTDDVSLIYCHSAAFSSAYEAGLQPMDPALGITWPLPVTNMSVRDERQAFIDPSFRGACL